MMAMEDVKDQELNLSVSNPRQTTQLTNHTTADKVQDVNYVHTTGKLLDLGWGLESIDLENPYKNLNPLTSFKEYRTLFLVYTLISLVLVGLTIGVRKYSVTLAASIVNVPIQCGIFCYCIFKHFQNDHNNTNKISNASHLTMAIGPQIDKNESISPVSVSYGFDFKQKTKQKDRKFWTEYPYFVKPHDFFSSFDNTFGREDDPIGIRPYYFRFTVILFGVITSIYTLIIIIWYGDSPINICHGSFSGIGRSIYALYNNSKPDYVIYTNSQSCAQNVFIFESIVTWVWWNVFTLWDMYALTDKYYNRLEKVTKTAIERFDKSSVVHSLRERTEQCIYKDVKLKMRLHSNIALFIILYILWLIFLFLLRLLLSKTLFFSIFFFVMFESLIYANISMSLIKICMLSKYPLTIAKLFAEPIYCESINDLLGWWQLRHIYQKYRSDIYIKALSPVITYGLIFIVILPFWAILSIISDYKSGKNLYIYPIQLAVTLVLSAIVLYCIKQFVSAYEEQIKHVGMLQKEVIRVQLYKNHFKNVDEIKGGVELLSNHMTNFDKPISVSGIPMTHGVWTMLRSMVGGVLVFISSIIVAVK